MIFTFSNTILTFCNDTKRTEDSMENYPILFEEQASHGNALFPCAVYEITAAFGSTEKIY